MLLYINFWGRYDFFFTKFVISCVFDVLRNYLGIFEYNNGTLDKML